MNKLFVSLLGASIAALVLAIGCGTWLFLQSWEEGKRLERQNRELQASLEASRIRLENFCEYPVEALCNLEEPHGSVSSVMSGMESSTPPLPEPSLPAPSGTADIRPETEISAPVASPAVENPPAHSESGDLQGKKLPLKAETPSEPAPDSDTLLSSPAPLPQTPGSDEAAGRMAQTESVSAATPSENAPGAAEKAVTAAEPQSLSPVLPKKTWTTLDIRNDGLTLRIAGEGNALTATGELLQNPTRYEVTLQGAWTISNRHPSTKLVKDLQIRPSGENTLLVFELNGAPQSCKITQEDPRTIAVSIR